MNTENSEEVDSPRPPEGYRSWLDYAVGTLDVRGVQIQRAFADEPYASPAAMKRAAGLELEELRAKVTRLEALMKGQVPKQSE